MQVFVARQAILDRKRRLYAYELLARPDAGVNGFDGTEAASATLQVIANSLLCIGIENLLGGKKGFLNVGQSLLVEGLPSMLPRESFVIEILETVQPDDQVVAACRNLHQQGYTIALDDFVIRPGFEPLTRIASVIKVDMRTTPKPEQELLLRTYQPQGIKMLAEKVETHEEFEWASLAGYDYFQGYFFARPQMVGSRRIPAAVVTCLRLLQEMQRADLDFQRLETLICEDLSLSHGLLRYVNSALFQRQSKIHSIGRALMVLGESGIRPWVALAALPRMAKNKPGELVTLSLLRARFCQSVAQLASIREGHLAFLMGLFSLLDALLDRPLEEALLQVGVSPVIGGALLGTSPEQDAFLNVYLLVREWEAGDWDAVEALALTLGVKMSALSEAYLESAEWAAQVLHAIA